MNQSEEHSYLVNLILMELSKLPNVRVWKQITGTFKTFDGNPFKIGVPGMADIGGICKTIAGVGIVLQIEVKTGKGKQSSDQRNWQKMIEERGGIYIVAREIEETVAQIKKTFTIA